MVTANVKRQLRVIYLGDMIIVWRKSDGNVDYFRQAQMLLYGQSVIMNLKKWNFFTSHIDYLSLVTRLGLHDYKQERLKTCMI